MKKMDKMRKLISFKSTLLILILSLISGCTLLKSPPRAKMIILIGIDGMGTDGFQVARTPQLNALVQDGALSLKARGVMPTVSAPIWGSILTGAGPEQHGITSNSWLRDNYSIEATSKDSEGFFPSIFTIIREQMPKAKTAIIYDWDGLGNIFNHKYLDLVELTKGYKETIKKAISYIIEEKPQFIFLYIGHPDEVGHESGYGSKEYYTAIENVDRELSGLVQELKKRMIYEEAHIIVLADHGGLDFGHGGESMHEIEVPWMITGPGVIKNRMIEQPINLWDTASTIAYLSGLKQPGEWLGRPVLGAFEANREEAGKNWRRYLPKPGSSVKSGLYTEPKELSFTVDAEGVEIRYTMDGSEPNPSSLLYKKPVILDKSATIAAKSMKENMESAKSVIRFTRILGIKNVFLKSKASSRYPSRGALSLVDGLRGTPNHRDGKWMGFEGNDLEATIDFGKSRDIRKVTIGFIKAEKSWIFLPRSIEFSVSENGKSFRTVGLTLKNEMKRLAGEGVNNIPKEFKGLRARYLKVKATNIGLCPEGHPGAGEKAWLFADEIIIE